uniref:CDP-diacylglycerol--serine O-phosphatidyltransferase n=1 Tax=Ananas comosus var. bracteatus TaxID=296719 RepID=A0A6V7QIQ8_ANACO|nr:unnamed protein product [Ananas comosus var. bracteatus]
MAVNGQMKSRRREYANSQEDNDVKLLSYFGEVDPWTAWAYKPRTISLLLLGTCLLIWQVVFLIRKAALIPIVLRLCCRYYVQGRVGDDRGFLSYSLLQAPSTVLIRPHPAIWRLVHGMAVVYLVALTFLLFQNRDDARQFMKYLHPDLGVELPERSYGADCRIYVPRIQKTGSKMSTFSRRRYSMSLYSLIFLAVLVDSIILDILICNWFGIWAGMHTVRYFDGKTYEWVGISRQPNIMGKVKRTLGQFTPRGGTKTSGTLSSGRGDSSKC